MQFDLVVGGAGPAGLSAAVYGASEGFSTLVADEGALGGCSARTSPSCRKRPAGRGRTTGCSSRCRLTGTDLSVSRTWPLARRPFLLESSMPGVLAVGDVRHGSAKRVASAVGEGSVAVQLLHGLFDMDRLHPRGRPRDSVVTAGQ
jgi:thioredoxin reductase